MSDQIPQFVLDYIAYLKNLANAHPDLLYSRYGDGTSTRPPLTFSAYHDNSSGWVILHKNAKTGQLLLREIVEPKQITTQPVPPMEYKSTTDIVPPTVAAPDGYFTLTVENKGLPDGYQAPTQIKITNASLDGVSQIPVPFNGRYDLPVRGGDQVTTQPLFYQVVSGSRVETAAGIYRAAGPFYTLAPQDGEHHSVTINWTPDSVTTPPDQPKPTAVVLPKDTFKLPNDTVTNASKDGAQSIFYPSTTPKQPDVLPLLPTSYVLKQRFVDPDNTFRATSIQQMYSFTPDNSARKITYNIGIQPKNITPVNYKVRNNTINTILKFTFTVPSFLFLNVAPVLQINPQQEVIITVAFNETDAKNKSLTNTRLYIDKLKWTVEPLNITGPVYVLRNLPAVVVGSSTPVQQTDVPVANTITSDGSYTKLYFGLAPAQIAMALGEHRTLKVDAWIGPDSVGPNKDRSTQLQFSANSIRWVPVNSSIMTIDSDNGNSNATVIGLAPGSSQFKAQIVQPPINVSANTWNTLYNQKSEIVGGGKKVTLPNGTHGIEIVGSCLVLQPDR